MAFENTNLTYQRIYKIESSKLADTKLPNYGAAFESHTFHYPMFYFYGVVAFSRLHFELINTQETRF